MARGVLVRGGAGADLGFLEGVGAPSAAEVRVAASLVDAMTAPLDLSVFEDRYAAAVAGLVAEKSGRVSPFE